MATYRTSRTSGDRLSEKLYFQDKVSGEYFTGADIMKEKDWARLYEPGTKNTTTTAYRRVASNKAGVSANNEVMRSETRRLRKAGVNPFEVYQSVFKKAEAADSEARKKSFESTKKIGSKIKKQKFFRVLKKL